MNKTIQINPELFKFTGTRKRSVTPKEITVKVPKEHNTTLSKRNSLMKFIRRHQESKNTLKNRNHDNTQESSSSDENQSDFDKSLRFLMDIADKNNDESKNQDTYQNVNMKFPENISPQYGCLKNGTLPTFRQFYGNQTMKRHHKPSEQLDRTFHTHQHVNTLGQTPSANYQVDSDKYDCHQNGNNCHQNSQEESNYLAADNNERQNSFEDKRNDTAVEKNDDTIISQKKLLKRTYRIGKRNADRKISVLVSNKTIRHQTSNKNQTLKKTHLVDVRRYLVKHGFIKIGSTAPPDVLRKMFESASMVCGNITNHNSETLMYNYMNPEKI